MSKKQQENKPSRYAEYKVLEHEMNKDGSFKITEKKPVLGKDDKPKICSIYPHEADIMNNGMGGNENEVAVATKRYYELEKPKSKQKEEK